MYDEPDYEEPWETESMGFAVQITNVQEDVFVSAIARDLAGRVSSKMLKKIEAHVEETVVAQLTARVDEVVADLVSKGMQATMQPSDQFSNPQGEPTTLTAFIADKASGYLEETVDSDGKPAKSTGYNPRGTTTRLNYHLKGVVTREFEKELGDGVSKIQRTIRDQMKDAAAAWLSKFQAETVSGIEAAKQLASRI